MRSGSPAPARADSVGNSPSAARPANPPSPASARRRFTPVRRSTMAGMVPCVPSFRVSSARVVPRSSSQTGRDTTDRRSRGHAIATVSCGPAPTALASTRGGPQASRAGSMGDRFSTQRDLGHDDFHAPGDGAWLHTRTVVADLSPPCAAGPGDGRAVRGVGGPCAHVSVGRHRRARARDLRARRTRAGALRPGHPHGCLDRGLPLRPLPAGRRETAERDTAGAGGDRLPGHRAGAGRRSRHARRVARGDAGGGLRTPP